MTSQQRTRKRITESNGNSSTVPWKRVVDATARKRGVVAPDRAVLVGISGIDASGKGFITAKLAERLGAGGWNVAAINADDWLNLREVCINRHNYADHFYKHAMRFDEMFEQLIIPLKESRGICLTADCADAKATSYRTQRYDFHEIDIVLLEGIFLFKPTYRHHFDLSVWVDCSFKAALARAIVRGQEGLSPQETVLAFETIYFPAQRIHLARDNPRQAVDFVVANGKSWPGR
jgi:uridine kinase